MVKWTNELLREEALKYTTRGSFSKNNSSAYYTSIKRGILEEICSHMNNRFYWTEDMIREEALKYNTRIEFNRGNDKAYRASIKMGILDDVCKHMIRLGNLYKRYIYIIEFENSNVYIGLTGNLERRKNEHISNSSNINVRKLISSNIKFKFNSDNILYSVDDAIKFEGFLINQYKERGYNVLNIAKSGGLGGNNIKWTKEILIEEALKYDRKISFYKNNRGAYYSASKMGILDDICKHMSVSFIKWTVDLIKEEALKHKTRSSFLKSGKGGYHAAKRRSILDDVCSHMLYEKT
jgi:predicted GIY-YIG superfamily endonuclease